MPNPTANPYIEPALLAWLDRAFPAPTITPKTHLNEIMFGAGQRDVLITLRNISLKQHQ